jgi:hypothetical protein
MRSIKAFAFAAVAGLLVAGSLQAQTTASGWEKLTGVNGSTGWFSWGSPGANVEHVYTSPYRSAFWVTSSSPNPALLPPYGTTGFGPSWDVYCVDFMHTSYIGTPYQAYFTNLGDAQANNSLLGTYTRSTSLEKYLQAAYLAQQIKLNPSSANEYNAAIWQVMSDNPFWYGSNGSTWTPVSTAVLAAAELHAGINASDWVVVTDQTFKNGGSQEYITQVTPEPATLLLLGTGLVVMLMAAGAFRRPTV